MKPSGFVELLTLSIFIKRKIKQLSTTSPHPEDPRAANRPEERALDDTYFEAASFILQLPKDQNRLS